MKWTQSEIAISGIATALIVAIPARVPFHASLRERRKLVGRMEAKIQIVLVLLKKVDEANLFATRAETEGLARSFSGLLPISSSSHG
jgi:hypothetical protein